MPRGARRSTRATHALWASAAALCLTCASHVQAQRTSSLSWVRLRGTESCISTQALAERVEQRLGRRAFVSASQADLSLEGHVERASNPAGFVATLVVSDRAGRALGRRVLRVAGDDCQQLEPSLVLVIALAMNPGTALAAAGDSAQPLSPEAQAMLEQLGLPALSEQQLRDELAVPEPHVQPAGPPAAVAARAGARVAASHRGPGGRAGPCSATAAIGPGCER